MTPAPTKPRARPRATPEQRRRARQRRRTIRRRRAVAGLVVLLIAAAAVAVIGEVGLGGSSSRHPTSAARPARPTPLAAPPFSVHEVDLTYVDATRSMSLRDGSRRPRRLVTRVLYPVPTPHHRLPVPFPLL